MDSRKLNDWMQVIGIFAVVGSLIFVGLQMKQTQEIALASAYQNRATSSIDRLIARASSPEYTSARAKFDRGDYDSISPEERVSLEEFLTAYMVMVENHHFQYESGFLPEEHWLRNVKEMQCVFAVSFNWDLIKGLRFRASFQSVLDEIIADAESDPIIC